VIGTLALVGFPFLSGYYSKDVIIEAVAEVAGNGPIQMYAYLAVLLGVFVTSFYSFRLLYLTFHGRERFRDAEAETHAGGHDDVSEGTAHAEAEAGHGAHAHDDHGHDGHGVHEPHESPWVVTVPLILLAIPSIAIGFLTVGPMLFGDFFANAIFVREANDTLAMVGERLFTSAVGFGLHFYASPAFWLAFAGFAVATYVYLFNPALATKARNALRWPVKVLENKYGFDKLWVDGFAGGGIKLGEQLSRRLDAGLIDGFIVNGSAAVVDRVAAISRRVQSGYLYHYAFAMIIGLIVMLGFLIRMLG
jgi:NADH-quinone oxidoreductase subunit L